MWSNARSLDSKPAALHFDLVIETASVVCSNPKRPYSCGLRATLTYKLSYKTRSLRKRSVAKTTRGNFNHAEPSRLHLPLHLQRRHLATTPTATKITRRAFVGVASRFPLEALCEQAAPARLMPENADAADASRYAVLSPRPAPRGRDAVVVVAQEALVWQERAERLAEANARLRSRVGEVEEVHRKSLTAVKNVPTLPNNHVFTKKLVDENHALRRETRALQRRLMKFEGPRSRQRSKPPQPSKRKGVHLAKATSPAAFRKGEKEDVVAKREEEEAIDQALAESSPPSPSIVKLARHPLVQELKTHLWELEVDVGRLRQDNELLRTELDQHQDLEKSEETRTAPQDEDNNCNIRHEDPQQLREGISAQLQQMKVLDARYQHLEEKARAKTALYKESTSRLEDMNTQLFDAQQQLAAQAEKLQVYSDQSACTDDLLQEIHLLRNENIKLNETVAALSSRPFDGLSKELQKKNLWIAQLEEEKRSLDEDRTRFQQDCTAARRANDQLRHRVETLTAEVMDLASELSQVRAECEQKTMEIEVAQLQLRFYTAPGDYGLMSAVGKALKEMKKQQRLDWYMQETVLSN